MPVHDQDLPFLPACLLAVVQPVVHAAVPAAVNIRKYQIKKPRLPAGLFNLRVPLRSSPSPVLLSSIDIGPLSRAVKYPASCAYLMFRLAFIRIRPAANMAKWPLISTVLDKEDHQ